MKKIGFLSFGHWAPSAQSRTESAADALLQSIDLAIEAERLGALGLYGASVIWHGLSTADQPSYVETVVARTARNLAIPRKARLETNPWKATPDVLKEAREGFLDRCAVCHGPDGAGQTQEGRNLYPKVPDLRLAETQKLSDGEIRYIIRNGVRLTGMPGWARPHDEKSDDSWKLVLFIRSLRQLTREEQAQQSATINSAHYVGSQSCQKCPHKSTKTGEKRRWQMLFATLAKIRTQSFQTLRRIPL